MKFHEGDEIRILGEGITGTVVGSNPVVMLVDESDPEGPVIPLTERRDGLDLDVWMVREHGSRTNRFFAEDQIELL